MTKAVLNLLEPIKLGSIVLPNRIVQAPLAGYSCAPMRLLATRHGQPGFTCTEMISAKDLMHRKQQPKRFLWRHPEEKIVCYQIAGNGIEEIARASQIVTQAGADIVDLNCGCPVKKIRSKGYGSKLLSHPEKIHALVKTMKENTDAVISIKIRIGQPHNDSDDLLIAQAAENAGADFITVHGRHWRQRYDVDCDLEPIKKIVDAINIPVFANGDMADTQSVINTVNKTGCHGVMIARASVGAPWLFKQIREELTGHHFQPPTPSHILNLFHGHITLLMQLENEKLAVLQSRKLAKYYSRGFPNQKDFVLPIQTAETFAEIEEVILDYRGLVLENDVPLL